MQSNKIFSKLKETRNKIKSQKKIKTLIMKRKLSQNKKKRHRLPLFKKKKR